MLNTSTNLQKKKPHYCIFLKLFIYRYIYILFRTLGRKSAKFLPIKCFKVSLSVLFSYRFNNIDQNVSFF